MSSSRVYLFSGIACATLVMWCMLAHMSSPSRKRTAGIAGLIGTITAGALGGALYMAFAVGGAAPAQQPQQVTIHQAAATASPTTASPKAKAAVKHKAKKKTATVSRNLVSAQNAAADPTPDPAESQVPPPIMGDGPGPFDVSNPKPPKP